MPADATAPAANLTLARFDKKTHDRSEFSCGFEPIDNFLKSSLTDQIKAGMVSAWVATVEDDPAVIGFYTLGAMAVRSEFGPAKWQRARVPDVPVIYIRAVAVRKDMQGKGLGSALVIDAMKRCNAISEQMALQPLYWMSWKTMRLKKDGHFIRISVLSLWATQPTNIACLSRWPMYAPLSEPKPRCLPLGPYWPFACPFRCRRILNVPMFQEALVRWSRFGPNIYWYFDLLLKTR